MRKNILINNTKFIKKNSLLPYACKVVFVSWTLIITMPILLVLNFVIPTEGIAAPLFLLLMIGATIHPVLVFYIKCPSCKKRTLFQGLGLPKFAKENNIYGMTGWSAIVLKVLLHQRYTCMHCGQKFEVKK